MKIIVLASGSKGNCIYIQTKTKTILIDAGISMLQIRSRLEAQGMKLNKIDMVLVSHEHTDHIKYLSSILDRTNATLYIHQKTYETANARLSGALTHAKKCFIETDKKYQIDELVFVPITLSHDVDNCFGFLVKELNDSNQNKTFASVTDTGYIPVKYLKALSTINVLLIESNHDVTMQKNSGRPWVLIQRVLSERGHMSNDLCSEILLKIANSNMKKVILAHISEECNTEKIAYQTCLEKFDNNLPFELFIAKQYESLPMIEVE